MRQELAAATSIGPAIRRETGDGAWRGSVLIAASALTFSTAGLFTGLIQTDAWTILFWRCLFGGLFIGGYILWRQGAAGLAAFRAIGRPGLAAAACSTFGTICFVHALRLTTVADVTIIYATAPFIAAGMAWLWLRQGESRATLGASLLALLGVAVMTDPALARGHLIGNLLALAMTALIATMMVIIRRHRSISMLPAACLSALACALLVLPFASPLWVSGADMLWLLLFGTLQFGLGLLLLTLGSRLMSAARAALIGNLELPLAPFWAWLAFGAWPSAVTWIGGAIVTVALMLDLIAGQRRGGASPQAGQDRPRCMPAAAAGAATPPDHPGGMKGASARPGHRHSSTRMS